MRTPEKRNRPGGGGSLIVLGRTDLKLVYSIAESAARVWRALQPMAPAVGPYIMLAARVLP